MRVFRADSTKSRRVVLAGPSAMLHMNEEMIGLLEAAKENVAIKRTDQKHVNRSLGHYLDIEKSH